MKTLLLSEIFPPRVGGSGRWFWEIYRRLPRDQFVIATAEHAEGANFDKTHDLRLTRLPWPFANWDLLSFTGARGYGRTVLRLRRLIAREGIDFLHCGRCMPEGVVAWLLKRVCGLQYICYVHGEELNYATYSRKLSWLVRRVLKGAEFLIANSRNTQRLLREDWQVPDERLRLLHPGVDTSYFVPADADAERRSELGWGDRPVLLTVGRLQKRKGHDQMIRALARIRRAVPDVLYAIVGEGEERPFLQELAVKEEVSAHVQFLGEISDDRLLSCYQQCNLFVLPNRQVEKDIEGFGMVLLEAQACGKPVVAGASGGTAETMRIPETGRVVPCEGPDQLAELLIEMLADREKLERMSQEARQWVVEQFDWESLSVRAAQLFSCCVAESVASGVA